MPPERSVSAVEEALAVITAALHTDGYDLHVKQAADRLIVSIEALEGACEECLSPPSVLASVMSTALGGLYAADEIDIAYPTEVG